MSDFSCFLKENAINTENVKYAVSKRFINPKTGKPMEWEFRTIDGATDDMIRKECTKRVPVKGKRGQYIPELDTDTYLGKICAFCVTYPNLNSAELQDNYGVKSADELLKTMLNAGEFIDLKAFVSELNGFDVGMEELVDEAKN
jgi:hypothetical protein